MAALHPRQRRASRWQYRRSGRGRGTLARTTASIAAGQVRWLFLARAAPIDIRAVPGVQRARTVSPCLPDFPTVAYADGMGLYVSQLSGCYSNPGVLLP